VNERRIGEIVAVDSWFSYYNDDPENIRNILDYGGGALMDIGCYSIHLSRLLLQEEPTAIEAAVRRDPATGVDIATSGILEFGDRISSFGCSTRAEPSQRVDIHGTEGRINIEIPFNIPADRPTRISVFAGGSPPAKPAVEAIDFEPANQYTLQAEAFAAAVLEGRPLPDSGPDLVHNIRVIEKVFAAAGPSGWT
jgi:predicted dehydrogenase